MKHRVKFSVGELQAVSTPSPSPPFLEVFGGPVGEVSHLPSPFLRREHLTCLSSAAPAGKHGAGLALGRRGAAIARCPSSTSPVPAKLFGFGNKRGVGRPRGRAVVSVERVEGALACVVTGHNLPCQKSSPAPKIYCLVTTDALRQAGDVNRPGFWLERQLCRLLQG